MTSEANFKTTVGHSLAPSSWHGRSCRKGNGSSHIYVRANGRADPFLISDYGFIVDTSKPEASSSSSRTISTPRVTPKIPDAFSRDKYREAQRHAIVFGTHVASIILDYTKCAKLRFGERCVPFLRSVKCIILRYANARLVHQRRAIQP